MPILNNQNTKDQAELPDILRRSETIDEIIDQNDGHLTKVTSIVFMLIFGLVFAAGFMVSYKETLVSSATIMSGKEPKEIPIKQSGKLIKLFAKNESAVIESQTIAWIESTADHSQVICLSQNADSAIYYLSNNKDTNLTHLFLGPFDHLGELQIHYQNFIAAQQQFNNDFINGYTQTRISQLLREISFQEEVAVNVKDKIELSKKELAISEEMLKDNNMLYQSKVLSKHQFKELEAKVISQKRILPDLLSELIQAKAAKNQKLIEITEVRHLKLEHRKNFEQNLNTLRSVIKEWELKYIVTAPCEGKINLNKTMENNQNVVAGQSIGLVNPMDNNYYALIKMPQFNSGKLELNQPVHLRLDAFPFAEFGTLEGKINYISNIATDSGIIVTVALDKGMRTSSNIVVPFRNHMNAQAIVQMSDMRIIEKLYYNLTSSLRK
jgi:HlyD family secretion protein